MNSKIIHNQKMLGSLFSSQGEFCARHPMEVVVSTLTIITSLMTIGSSLQHSQDKVCGWNYECTKEQTLKVSDVILLSIARCLALVYIYLQFRHLRRLGSKHVLGISGVFTIFSSFVFTVAFVKMYGNTMAGLYEVLPFFLFLIDLSKASALAVFALSSTTREEIHQNIGKAMALLGPSITLDMIVKTLAVGVGTLSGVQQLEAMCSFGCLSIVANYGAFMTFYPACLALVLELTMDVGSNQSAWRYKKLAEELRDEHETKKPNPVAQRVKLIMSVGLAIVHVHSKLIAPRLASHPSDLLETYDMYREPEMSIWQFYLYKIFAVHVDYGLTLVLGIGLLLKYVFVDRHMELIEIKHTLELQKSLNSITCETQTEELCDLEENSYSSDRPRFHIGEEEEEEPSVGNKSSNTVSTKDTQTEVTLHGLTPLKRLLSLGQPRPLDVCLSLLKTENGVSQMTDDEIKLLVEHKHIPSYKLESILGDHERGVSIRRQMTAEKISCQDAIDSLPYSNYDYSYVDGACCENVVGYMPVPVGTAGPLILDGRAFMVPLATTEGCLVASTNRGCRALSQSGGVHSSVVGDGMTRGPAVRFQSAARASKVKAWLENSDNFDLIKESFDLTSRFARLERVHVAQAGRLLYIRFVAKTGDAMGMNMLSKGTERALHTLQEVFPDMEILSLSGNFCTDKKASAINWIEGRGKSVVCDAVIPASVVKNTLKTSVPALVDLNIQKNLVGSAMAGSIGGFNAHAANIVAAIFIATGQDPAQTVASSNCITMMEPTGPDNRDLYISCTMPSIEVGTVGGGTILPPQAACLQMLGVLGSVEDSPGENARQLARIVCATVLAGELSLMSALAAGHLVRSHLKHNRSSISLGSSNIEGSLNSASLPFASTPGRQDLSMPNIQTCRTGNHSSSQHYRVGKATPVSTPPPSHQELSPSLNKTDRDILAMSSQVSVNIGERADTKETTGEIRNRKPKTHKGKDKDSHRKTTDLGEKVGTCIKHVS